MYLSDATAEVRSVKGSFLPSSVAVCGHCGEDQAIALPFRKRDFDTGFRDVRVNCVTKAFPVETVESFWGAMVKGSAPIQMLKNSMSVASWGEKEIQALKYLRDLLPSTPTALTSDAWLGTAIK